MPGIRFGTAAYRRDNGNLPELRLVNMFAETTPAADGGVTLLSRPGLVESAVRGAGPIDGMFSQAGTFGGAVFTVSGGVLYRDGFIIGSITGGGPVSFAASANELVVTAGMTAYSYDGTDLAAIAFPDAAHVTAVAFMAGLFIYARASSHRFYWSAVLDGRTVDALDYASAESAPDELLDILKIGDNLYLLGNSTIEVWASTGSAELPFNRIQQRLFRKGVISSGCAEEMDNSLFWIGDDGIVYRAAEVPQRVSDHGIEERIEQSASALAFSFIYEGHQFFCIRLEGGTFCYDAATQQWSEFLSHGRDAWRIRSAVTAGRTVLLGDDTNGTVWFFSGFDEGGPFERLFSAAFAIKGGTVIVDNIVVEANVGWTDVLAGQGSDPVIEMRSSRDGGATFSNWRSAPMGQQGQYRTRTIFRRCGIFDAPGALFEFRCTDPVPLRISSVSINEAGGGRAR